MDKHFEEFLLKLFGPEFFEVYKANAMARLEILKHFEMMKRKFNPGVDERSRLQLNFLGEELSGPKLTEFVKKYNEREEAEAAEQERKPAKCTQRGMSSIDLPPALMTSFFEPLFEKIIAKVLELMQAARDKKAPVNLIFMVGGFSESPFLKSRVKKLFSEGESKPDQPQV